MLSGIYFRVNIQIPAAHACKSFSRSDSLTITQKLDGKTKTVDGSTGSPLADTGLSRAKPSGLRIYRNRSPSSSAIPVWRVCSGQGLAAGEYSVGNSEPEFQPIFLLMSGTEIRKKRGQGIKP